MTKFNPPRSLFGAFAVAGIDIGSELRPVFLYGSRAQGVAGEGSDWDLVVVENGARYDVATGQILIDGSLRPSRQSRVKRQGVDVVTLPDISSPEFFRTELAAALSCRAIGINAELPRRDAVDFKSIAASVRSRVVKRFLALVDHPHSVVANGLRTRLCLDALRFDAYSIGEAPAAKSVLLQTWQRISGSSRIAFLERTGLTNEQVQSLVRP